MKKLYEKLGGLHSNIRSKVTKKINHTTGKLRSLKRSNLHFPQMRQHATEFPHFIRKITAPVIQSVELAVWLGVFTVIAINILYQNLFDQSNEQKVQMIILQSPFKSLWHEYLGNIYLETNLTQAQKEYALAQHYYSVSSPPSLKSKILGVQIEPQDKWTYISSQFVNAEKEVFYWEEVLKQDPNYSFGYAKLVLLYSQLHQNEKSQKYLQTLKEKDSTNSLITKLSFHEQ